MRSEHTKLERMTYDTSERRAESDDLDEGSEGTEHIPDRVARRGFEDPDQQQHRVVDHADQCILNGEPALKNSNVNCRIAIQLVATHLVSGVDEVEDVVADVEGESYRVRDDHRNVAL